MEKAETGIILYQNDFRNRTEADDDRAFIKTEVEKVYQTLKETYRKEIKSPSTVFCLVCFTIQLANDLRGRFSFSLSANRSELTNEIVVKNFSLENCNLKTFQTMCKELIGLQIRSVDGETVLTAKYKNEYFVPKTQNAGAFPLAQNRSK